MKFKGKTIGFLVMNDSEPREPHMSPASPASPMSPVSPGTEPQPGDRTGSGPIILKKSNSTAVQIYSTDITILVI